MADVSETQKTSSESASSSPKNEKALPSPTKESGGNNNNNWWGSWINTAKSKSASVLEAVKRDLDEISTAVRTEVTNAGSVIGETLKLDEPESTASTVKKSLSSFFGQVSEALAPTLDDDDAEAVLITSDGAVTLTGFQKHLAELQSNEATYMAPPDSTLTENYQRWLEIVEQDQFTQNQLAKHLSSSEILNEKYLSLVPDKISHMEFWKRYLFKRALLEDALANAEIAERRAQAEVRSNKTISPKRSAEIIQTEQPKTVLSDADASEDKPKSAPPAEELVIEDTDIKWEAEDFGDEEISEAEQARLLEEYEAEIQEREKRKSQIVPLEEKLHGNTKNAAQMGKGKGDAKSKSQQNSTAAAGGKKQTAATSGANKKQSNSGKSANAQKSTDTTTKPKATGSKQNNNNNNNNSSNAANNSSGEAKKKNSNNSEKLKVQSKHFDGDSPDEPKVKSLAEDLKDAGSASDESWEKDFDLSDRDQ